MRIFEVLRVESSLTLILTSVLLTIVTVTVRFGSIHQAQKAAAACARFCRVSVSPHDIEELIDGAAAVLPFEPGCLVKAIGAVNLLEGGQTDPVLRIGVDPSASEFRAHAWVEVEGKIVLGSLPDGDRFRPLPLVDKWP